MSATREETVSDEERCVSEQEAMFAMGYVAAWKDADRDVTPAIGERVAEALRRHEEAIAKPLPEPYERRLREALAAVSR